MQSLRIGVNALYLIPGGVGGTEIYLRHLLAALAEIDAANHYFVFTNRETAPDLAPARPNFTVVPQAIRASYRPARIMWEQTILPITAAARRIDVLFNPGFTAPILCACPQVTVFHDMQHKRHPEHFRWFDLPFWRLLLYASAHTATRLVTGSEATRDDLQHYYRLPRESIVLAPNGVDPRFFDIAHSRHPEPLLLTVSTLHPHKNLDRLLRVFADFRRTRPGYRLVIAAMRGFHTSKLEEQRHALELDESVEFTGWISRDELYTLYARASAFVYPSTFEGFGLPVLEAMAAGIPTVCSHIEPLASMAGNAALQFDPGSDAALHDALMRITGEASLRNELIQAGPARAALFSWRTAAQITLDTLVAAAQKASAPASATA